MERSNPHFPSYAENKELVLKHEEGRRMQKSHQSKPPSRNLDTLAWRLWSELSKHAAVYPLDEDRHLLAATRRTVKCRCALSPVFIALRK